MATLPSRDFRDDVVYPDSDGKPMAETPIHRQNLTDLIELLDTHFAADPQFYVSGNMFLYYVPGDPRRTVSPDVFAVRGIAREGDRRVYKTWEEHDKGPDLVIELTSRSTRREDTREKFALYQDVLCVREYFLFDPLNEYLKPPLKGFRLAGGRYEAIAPVAGRLPSEVVRLHLERDGQWLRLVVPETGERLLTGRQARALAEAARRQAEAERRQAEAARKKEQTQRRRSDTLRRKAEEARRLAEAENEALREELEQLRRRLGGR